MNALLSKSSVHAVDLLKSREKLESYDIGDMSLLLDRPIVVLVLLIVAADVKVLKELKANKTIKKM